MTIILTALVALTLAASLAAVALLYTLDFPNLGTDHKLPRNLRRSGLPPRLGRRHGTHHRKPSRSES